MIKVISKRHEVTEVWYEWQFQYKADPYFRGRFNGGCSFKVDKAGRLLDIKNQGANFARVRVSDEYIDFGIQECTRTYMEPAVGKCFCGRGVVLSGHYHGASDCECGRWYGMNGEEMVPPDQWQEPIDYDY